MSSGSAVCAACRLVRPMGTLLAVTARATGRMRYVCRPSLSDQVPGRQPCFGIVGSADEYTIALATDVPRPAEVQRRDRASSRRAAVAAVAGHLLAQAVPA